MSLNAPRHTRPAPESMIMDDEMIKALMFGKAETVAELRRERSLGGSSRPEKIEQQPSAPPPLLPSLAASDGHGQIRVFIGDMQHYQSVTVTPRMTASNLISFFESRGVLKGGVGLGQWVLFEQVLDLGMERPIRPFEILKPAGVGRFLVRMHDTFGPFLSSGRVPETTPAHNGWVEWELRKGKWDKTWLELRQHGLWIAEKDGAASELLCSLTSFDVHTPTSSTLASHKQKSPKPYVFALKSVNSVTYLQDKNDYVHTFCCKDEEGEAWVESILLARSYILHQERHILNSGQNELKRRPRTATIRPSKKLVADSNSVLASGSL
ncbi:hypothetical protein DL96DRAFT_1533796 [Flagelloscypha sp. PMI_526]|nr:hypothetical protein DL96DRAFT_1533796 [Flagelloscypha sp. PMI_526]